MTVGGCERHMPLQQRCHLIFRDGLFVAKAIAYDGCTGNRVEIHGVIAGAWHMKKLQLPRNAGRSIDWPQSHAYRGAQQRDALLRRMIASARWGSPRRY